MAGDLRATRTRKALIGAFNHLFLNRREKRIRVPDIIAAAGVGRSTFYDHFPNAEALRLEALSVPFAAFADAAVGRGDEQAMERLLTHVWENRNRARSHLCGRGGDQAMRLLSDMVESRLGDPRALVIAPRLAAQQLAAAAFIPVRAWLLGEAPASVSRLAASICASGRSLASALSRIE